MCSNVCPRAERRLQRLFPDWRGRQPAQCDQRRAAGAHQERIQQHDCRERHETRAHGAQAGTIQLGRRRPHRQLRTPERHQAARPLPDVALADWPLDDRRQPRAFI